MGILQKVSKVALFPSVAIGNLITKGLEKITKKDYNVKKVGKRSEELSKTTFGKVLGTSIAVTGTALLGVAAIPSAASVPSVTAGASKIISSVGRAAVPKSIGGAVGRVALAGAVTTAGGRTLIKETTKGVFKGGKAVGELYEKKGSSTTPKEGLKTAGLLGAGLVAGAVVVPKITEKIIDLTEKGSPKILDRPVSSSTPAGPVGEVPLETLGSNTSPNEKLVKTDEGLPKTPETTTIQTGPAKKRKKRRSKAPQQKISQSVKLNIVQNQKGASVTKRYLNVIPVYT